MWKPSDTAREIMGSTQRWKRLGCSKLIQWGHALGWSGKWKWRLSRQGNPPTQLRNQVTEYLCCLLFLPRWEALFVELFKFNAPLATSNFLLSSCLYVGLPMFLFCSLQLIHPLKHSGKILRLSFSCPLLQYRTVLYLYLILPHCRWGCCVHHVFISIRLQFIEFFVIQHSPRHLPTQ